MSTDQPTVLLVEDEPAQREVLSYNLEADGFRVTAAENGEEALWFSCILARRCACAKAFDTGRMTLGLSAIASVSP